MGRHIEFSCYHHQCYEKPELRKEESGRITPLLNNWQAIPENNARSTNFFIRISLNYYPGMRISLKVNQYTAESQY